MGFKKNCFVIDYTSEYLEVRWMDDGSIERIPTHSIDDLLRVGHADGLGPDGVRTNLQYLQASEALGLIQTRLAERMKAVNGENEERELNHLVRRIFAEGKCSWDTRNANQLLALLITPEKVGLSFKFRERIHRFFCHVK